MVRSKIVVWLSAIVLAFAGVAGCTNAGSGPGGPTSSGVTEILTDTSFLADVVRNVAGDRFVVSSLMPAGADPHSFEPTPKDAQRVAECLAMVVNVVGLLPVVDDLVTGAGGQDKLVIEAAAGIPGLDADPHCWLDPLLVVTYTENIAEGLTLLDPAGAEVYRSNAAAYADKLRELDSWIKSQVETIPAERRLLVTDHDSFGRFATRYGFEIVGAIFPTPSGEGSPSARQLADLVIRVRATGAPAIFVESASNASLAEQVGREAGVRVVSDLNAHSLVEGVSSYVEMMRWDVTKIVNALQ